MKLLKTTLPAFIIGIFFAVGMKAQETGYFEKYYDFAGENRTVSYYVPLNYDAENEYKLMICLHGMGDSSPNFRNALISGLKWHTFMHNTIFVCPDGGSDQSRDFFTPDGDEEIIRLALDSALANYNIDESKIFLEGFSLGGRSAIKYGLDHWETFAGLLLNTPAMQGPWDAMNMPGLSLMFEYENASKIPVAVSVGMSDYSYINVTGLLDDLLSEANAIYMTQYVPSMGHSVASQAYMQICWDFINDPTPLEYDVETREILVPDYVCDGELIPSAVVRNLGSSTISALSVKYKLNGGEEVSYDWTGEIAPYENEMIYLPAADLSELENNIEISVALEGDENAQNDLDSKMFFYRAKGIDAPFFEGFEDAGSDFYEWEFIKSGNLSSWQLDNEVQKTGNYSIFTYNQPFFFLSAGLAEEIITPAINLSSAVDPAFSFDVAYNYLRFDPPRVSETTYFADTLEIYISTDCNKTFELIYKKGGSELATSSEPIVNPQSLNEVFFIPDDDEWRNDAVLLSDYSDVETASFKIRYVSAMGGSINMDNIVVDTYDPSDVERAAVENYGIAVYPNPASDFVYVESERFDPIGVRISVSGALGDEIANIDGATAHVSGGVYKIDVRDLTPGAYFVKFFDGQRTRAAKLIVK